jgi:hypothetical protein
LVFALRQQLQRASLQSWQKWQSGHTFFFGGGGSASEHVGHNPALRSFFMENTPPVTFPPWQ